jgi:hypothetical protein
MAVIYFTASPHSQKQRASGRSHSSLPVYYEKHEATWSYSPPIDVRRHCSVGCWGFCSGPGVQVERRLWNAAEYLGFVPWNDPNKLLAVVKQIRSSLYMSVILFGDSAISGTAGKSESFLWTFFLISLLRSMRCLLHDRMSCHGNWTADTMISWRVRLEKAWLDVKENWNGSIRWVACYTASSYETATVAL